MLLHRIHFLEVETRNDLVLVLDALCADSFSFSWFPFLVLCFGLVEALGCQISANVVLNLNRS